MPEVVLYQIDELFRSGIPSIQVWDFINQYAIDYEVFRKEWQGICDKNHIQNCDDFSIWATQRLADDLWAMWREEDLKPKEKDDGK